MASLTPSKGSERASRVLCRTAPNPSPMTLEGTNSYLVLGSGEALAIDPGPADIGHVRELTETAARNGCRIAAIAVTHGHPDHAPGAALLRELTSAPVYAHPGASFAFTRAVRDRSDIAVDGAVLHALHAPGHASDHLVFWFEAEEALFTGDVIVGRGTVVVAPPGGDMRAYQATLRRLRDAYPAAKTIYGGHGARVEAPLAKIEEYLAHRERRERQVLQTLAAGERTIPQIVAHVYRDVDRTLWPAAARQVLAHLLALASEGRVRTRSLERAPNPDERAVLASDLSATVDRASAAVARAELGFGDEGGFIEAYSLAGPQAIASTTFPN